jgi:hypothetical protein
VAETGIGIKDTVNSKAVQWRERIAEQERSGLSVKQFCQERGFSAWSFYDWRKRLRESPAPVRFPLVERRSGSTKPATAPMSKSYPPVESNCASGPE